MTKIKQRLLDQPQEFLTYLKSKYLVFHGSNVFFRDLHYGVMSYLDAHAVRYSYAEAEDLTRQLIGRLESLGILHRIDDRTWMLNYEHFKKPVVKKPEPAKPAAPGRPVPGSVVPASAERTAGAERS